MRLLISVLALSAALMGGARAATPAQVWPVRPPEMADAKLPESAAGTLSPTLGPALKFEGVFLRILAGAPVSEWLPAMRGFAAATANDPINTGVREVAKAWVARAGMEEVAKALDQAYAINVRYPASLSAVEKSLPPEWKNDPWGDPWTYSTHAPKGFANQAGQRYQIGPKRFPDLGMLRDVTTGRKGFTPPAWKVTLKVVGENRALEFQRSGTVVGLITAGGEIEGYRLLYVGEGWALLAARDQLFTVSF